MYDAETAKVRGFGELWLCLYQKVSASNPTMDRAVDWVKLWVNADKRFEVKTQRRMLNMKILVKKAPSIPFKGLFQITTVRGYSCTKMRTVRLIKHMVNDTGDVTVGGTMASNPPVCLLPCSHTMTQWQTSGYGRWMDESCMSVLSYYENKGITVTLFTSAKIWKRFSIFIHKTQPVSTLSQQS